MRIDRPDGIAQENRSHPFFILLRRFADIQKDEAMTASKTFLVSLFQHGIIIFILLGSAASYLPNLIIVLPLVSIFAYMTYSNYRQLQLLLHNNVFDEVDHMIHSNEYQLSNLNMEKMVNTMNRCAEATGKLIQYRLDVRNTSIYHIFIGVLVMIYPFLIRGELF